MIPQLRGRLEEHWNERLNESFAGRRSRRNRMRKRIPETTTMMKVVKMRQTRKVTARGLTVQYSIGSFQSFEMEKVTFTIFSANRTQSWLNVSLPNFKIVFCLGKTSEKYFVAIVWSNKKILNFIRIMLFSHMESMKFPLIKVRSQKRYTFLIERVLLKNFRKIYLLMIEKGTKWFH